VKTSKGEFKLKNQKEKAEKICHINP